MDQITIGQGQKMTCPNPFALLSVRKEDGSTNLMAISWWTYLSNHPPMLGVCLSKKGLSHSLIEANGEFALSVVGEELKESAKKCGACSGRTIDKAVEFDIPLTDCEAIGVKAVAGSRVIYECRLVGSLEVGDHIFYSAEVIACRGDSSVKQLFAFDGYARLDTV